jgi:hypothetical protein
MNLPRAFTLGVSSRCERYSSAYRRIYSIPQAYARGFKLGVVKNKTQMSITHSTLLFFFSQIGGIIEIEVSRRLY